MMGSNEKPQNQLFYSFNLDEVVPEDHCKEAGIHVRTSKTGRGLIIEWTTELRSVIERAKLMKPHFRQPIIATRGGKAFTGSGFATLWRRAMVKAYPKGREAERYTFNDLRSKSASDTVELSEASARLGHTSTAVTKRHYVRKPAKVKPLR
jgi:integrase